MKAALKITPGALSCLIAVLSRLSEQLHDDRRNRARQILQPLAWGCRLPCDVAVHQFHRIGCHERKGPGHHFVECHSESIKIAPGIDRAIHSPGLFGSHIGECSGDGLGRTGRLALTQKARCNPKTHEPRLTRRWIKENIWRLYVLVDQPLLVQPAEGGCDTDSEAQELRQLHRSRKQSIESLTTTIFEHERHLPRLLGEGEGPNRPGWVEFIPQRVFVLDLFYGLQRWLYRRRS